MSRKAKGKAASEETSESGEKIQSKGNRRTIPPARAAAGPKSANRGVAPHVRMAFLRDRLKHSWFGMRDRVAVGMRVLAAVGCIAVAVVLGKAVEVHARTSPSFALRQVEVTGMVHLDRAAVLLAAGVTEGQNAFVAAPEEMRERLLDHRWVASAEVERRLPGTLRIHVREHEPVAILALSGVTYLVSSEAVVFKQLGATDPVDLPVITGVDRTRFTADPGYRKAILENAVAALSDHRLAGLAAREPVAEIHMEADDSVSLFVGHDATQVRLGHGPFRRKLRRFRSVLDTLAARHKRPAYVYLDNARNPDRVTLRLR